MIPCTGGNQQSVVPDVFVIAFEVVVEVGNNAEEITKFAIIVTEQIIEPALSYQDYLDIQWNRLWLQSGRRSETIGLARRFNAHTF